MGTIKRLPMETIQERVGGDNGGIKGRAEEVTKLKQNKGKEIETEVNNNNEEFPPLTGTRGIHVTGVKKMRGHGAHADKPYYFYAKHMYNLDRTKYLRVKMPILVFTCFSIGVVVPVYVIIFQQRKTAST
ncbi:hypothetical protein GIB67_003352 [Kingdonia uniflora]|uniref:Transmembrane protein n=1 Tax=Kingdonia uniflora TaxID=39325 RepID=A0A7J7P9P5_9MAGN|nr:hypothetical protein GIB67_003352 [Kingdonia uniflora]